MALLGIGASVVVWLAVLDLYSRQQETNRVLCATVHEVYLHQVLIARKLGEPPPTRPPPCTVP